MTRWYLCVTLFFSLVAQGQNLDIDLLRQFHQHRIVQLDPTFKMITQTTSPISMACPVVVFGTSFFRHDTASMRKGLVIVASMATSAIITLGLKYGIDRKRPFQVYPEIERLSAAGSPSFPSGHASNAFSTATALSLEFPKWYVIAPSMTWATAVGYSRMHLGVHYPSDVLVGAIVGAGSAWLCHYLNKRIFQK